MFKHYNHVKKLEKFEVRTYHHHHMCFQEKYSKQSQSDKNIPTPQAKQNRFYACRIIAICHSRFKKIGTIVKENNTICLKFENTTEAQKIEL